MHRTNDSEVNSYFWRGFVLGIFIGIVLAVGAIIGGLYLFEHWMAS